MHIQSLIIKNFKSYRDFSLIESLNEKINLIIGSNGHGKSNFLDAIIFVLTDKYSNLRHEDKKLLVHEEPGEEITQISVELVIENKLRRFPVDKDFVKISKIYHVNQNIEEILINDKKILKSDFKNLLESVGFCRQNPYYIIQQGKINTFIDMNDIELFDQFSELTGTKIYEEKKSESLKLLEDAADNKLKILKQSHQIDEYILKLENQCQDLSTFEKLEKRKKACQEIIFSDKLSLIQLTCDILDERKVQKSSELQELLKELNKIKTKLNERLTKIIEFEEMNKKFEKKLQKCDNEISNLKNFLCKEKASLNILESNKNTSDSIKSDLIKELSELTNKKQKISHDLNNTNKKLNIINTEILNVGNLFKEINIKLEMLILKQSDKSTGFANKDEKKQYVECELQKFKNSRDESNQEIISCQNEIESDSQKLSNLTIIKEDLANSKASLTIKISEIKESISNNQKIRFENSNLCKKNDIKITELSEELETLQENNKIHFKLIPNYEVLKMVLKIKKEKIPGFIGILIDILDIDERFKDSIDLIAKDKLYSIIVDNFDTANKIIEYNKYNNGPVISILPLDWNQDFSKNYNYSGLNDSSPLVNFIKIKQNFLEKYDIYKNDINGLIHKIFGKTLLVKNYDTGLKLAKDNNLNCITRDNEIIYGGGFLTKIGTYDNTKQRISLYEKISGNLNKAEEMISLKENLENLKITCFNSEADVLKELQNFQLKKNEIYNKIQGLTLQEAKLNDEILNLNETIRNKKNFLNKLINDKVNLDSKVKNYNNILNSNNFSNITLIEKEEILNLKNNRIIYEKKLIELEKAKQNLETEKIGNETELNNLLLKKEAEILNDLKDIDLKSQKNQTFLNSNEEGFLKSEIEASYDEINSLEVLREKIKTEILNIENNQEFTIQDSKAIKKELNKLLDKINLEEGELKNIFLSFNENTEKKNNFVKKIANLGKIDIEEKENLQNLKERQISLMNNESGIDIREPDKKLNKQLESIFKELDKINNKIKKYEKINRFALEDYKQFKSKREEINDKLNDLKEKENEILNVIKVLDNKKENAIQLTFEKVNKSFEFFFKELVPNGKGCLDLYDISSGISQVNNINNSSKGISIKVSFSGIGNSFQNMHLLSGGQKTAVVLALIFALSRVDPAPFYILDEIDAALDNSMRVNLAKLICSLSEQNQYIISTFKSEILEVANNVYKVKFANKTTNISKISKEEARGFIKEINNS